MKGAERILFGALPKEVHCRCGCHGRHTLDAISGVFAWSMQALAAGVFPRQRHDETPWEAKDSWRQGYEGRNFGFYAALFQARGDWAWYKEFFGFPSWRGTSICWRCEADSENIPWRDFALSAAWRTSRLTPEAFFAKQRRQGTRPCRLFSCPGFTISMICIDVLHALDFGRHARCAGQPLLRGARRHLCRPKSSAASRGLMAEN